MPTPARLKCLAIRRGEVSQEKALKWAERLEENLEFLIKTSELPERPDYETINRTLVKMHNDWWIASDYI
jgi:hypothetical protein